MRTRFRTLLLAGAAVLGVSAAAVAQVTVNGSPATISQIVQMVWNGQNISSSNPLPVNVVSGGSGGSSGSVTAAGTNGTQAQAVQGITNGVPVPVSLAAAIPNVITSTAQGANAVVNGTIYTTNLLANNSNPYPVAYYTCSASPEGGGGTLYVESTLDGSNFFARNGTAGTTVAAGASVDVKVPMSTNGIRCRYVNGTTAQTKFLLTGSATRY